MMERTGMDTPKFIVNVSAMVHTHPRTSLDTPMHARMTSHPPADPHTQEGKFYRFKSAHHPHTNMVMHVHI